LQPEHAWLSQHYRWALDQAFLQKGHSHVIIVEDDMLFSPDFLHFFAATAVLLEQDPSLWCISTWNDNGLKTFDWDPMRMVFPLARSAHLLVHRVHVHCALVFSSHVAYGVLLTRQDCHNFTLMTKSQAS